MIENNYRIILIGDSNVGKTSIIKKLLYNYFDYNEMNTIGAIFDKYTKSVNGVLTNLQIWDTAGQEKYRSLAPIYFQNSSGAILVFDVTNRGSFESLSYWINAFRSVSPDNSVIFIVGNKIDLNENREISTDEALNWSNINNCEYIEVSALNGTGIIDLFNDLIQLLNSIKEESHKNLTIPKQTKEKKCC